MDGWIKYASQIVCFYLEPFRSYLALKLTVLKKMFKKSTHLTFGGNHCKMHQIQLPGVRFLTGQSGFLVICPVKKMEIKPDKHLSCFSFFVHCAENCTTTQTI